MSIYGKLDFVFKLLVKLGSNSFSILKFEYNLSANFIESSLFIFPDIKTDVIDSFIQLKKVDLQVPKFESLIKGNRS